MPFRRRNIIRSNSSGIAGSAGIGAAKLRSPEWSRAASVVALADKAGVTNAGMTSTWTTTNGSSAGRTWSRPGDGSRELQSSFELQPGLRLAVWPRKSLAHDSGLPPGAASATEFSLGHNVASRAEVDALMAQAKVAGAVIVKPAQETFSSADARWRPGAVTTSTGTTKRRRTRVGAYGPGRGPKWMRLGSHRYARYA